MILQLSEFLRNTPPDFFQITTHLLPYIDFQSALQQTQRGIGVVIAAAKWF